MAVRSAAAVAYFRGHQFYTFCKTWRWLVAKLLNQVDFCHVTTYRFRSKKVLSVWEFAKNRVFEYITKKKHQNTGNNMSYNMAISDFLNLEFLISQIFVFRKWSQYPKFWEISKKPHILIKTYVSAIACRISKSYVYFRYFYSTI